MAIFIAYLTAGLNSELIGPGVMANYVFVAVSALVYFPVVALILFMATRRIREATLLGQPSDGQSDTLQQESRIVCSQATSTYGCWEPVGRTAYWTTLMHVYSILVPEVLVSWVSIGQVRLDGPPTDGASILAFYLLYMRLLNFWLKVEACREKPTAQLARFWRTAFFGWFYAANWSLLCTFVQIDDFSESSAPWFVVGYLAAVFVMALKFPSRSRPLLRCSCTVSLFLPFAFGQNLVLTPRPCP
jgi:hypothetical protein